MYNLAKAYNRDYYFSRAKIRVIYRFRITKVKIWRRYKLTTLWIAARLLALAFKICPKLKRQLDAALKNRYSEWP